MVTAVGDEARAIGRDRYGRRAKERQSLERPAHDRQRRPRGGLHGPGRRERQVGAACPQADERGRIVADVEVELAAGRPLGQRHAIAAVHDDLPEPFTPRRVADECHEGRRRERRIVLERPPVQESALADVATGHLGRQCGGILRADHDHVGIGGQCRRLAPGHGSRVVTKVPAEGPRALVVHGDTHLVMAAQAVVEPFDLAHGARHIRTGLRVRHRLGGQIEVDEVQLQAGAHGQDGQRGQQSEGHHPPRRCAAQARGRHRRDAAYDCQPDDARPPGRGLGHCLHTPAGEGLQSKHADGHHHRRGGGSDEQQAIAEVAPRIASVDQPAQAPAGRQAQRQHLMHEQPWHLLAGNRVADPTECNPPGQERQPRPVEHDLMAVVWCRHEPPPSTLPQTGRHGRDADNDRHRLVEQTDHSVVEPRLAGTRDLLLCQPVAEAADNPAREPPGDVREEGREEHDLQPPEGGSERQPLAPAESRCADGAGEREEARHDERSGAGERLAHLVANRRPPQHREDRARGKGHDERQHEHRQIECGGRACRLAAAPAAQRDEHRERTDDHAGDEAHFFGGE